MALRYRNEYVLTRLRTAYSLKHCDDSLLLNDGYDLIAVHRDAADIEADIVDLSSRLQLDADAQTVTSSTTSISHEDSQLPGGPADENDGVDEIAIEHEIEQAIEHANELRELTEGHTGSQIENRAGNKAENQLETKLEDSSGEPSGELFGDNHMNFHVNDFGLDIEDDSDFEDNILQATKDIKYNALSQPPDKPHKYPADIKPQPSHHSIRESANLFAKREMLDGLPKSSLLTSKLTVSHNDPREQYLEAVSGLQSSGTTCVQLKMNIGGHDPVEITVKHDCTTHFAIGYAIMKADIEPGDANFYNLRIVEDDGEPDEDFPALERTRAVASYHVDEFAIVRATDSEYRENSKRTPNKISFKSPAKNASTTQLPLLGSSFAFRPRASSVVPTRSVTLNVPLRPQESTRISSDSHRSQNESGTQVSPRTHLKVPSTDKRTSYASSLSGSKLEMMAVRIYMHPFDPILSQVFWKDDMIHSQTRIKDLFEQMCREKMMDSDMFVLRKTDPSHEIINNNAMVFTLVPPPISSEEASLSNGSLTEAAVDTTATSIPAGETSTVSLEVIPLRNLPPSQQTARPRSSSLTMLNLESAAKAKRSSSNNILQNTVLAMQPLGFYKYPVLRRQQMSFLGRGERELVIDGEYIHIMPPTDWSLLDQPKTTTFHIRQVLRVKQSRKVSTNFSIMVMKSTGPKRYDLESTDTPTTVEIVDRLQRLKSARSKSIPV